MAIEFKRATRAQVPLKLGITGPSGSGKTTAALLLARGLVGSDGTIALLDTENGSASLYSDITEFDTLNMTPPYIHSKFIGAIDAATQAGYKVLIIDSASHEWLQTLQDKEAMDARGGNNWTNWASFTKKHEEFLASLRNASIHIICCLRAKEKHEMNESKKVVKMGVGSEMKPGFEFELTSVFELAMDHSYKVGKDRTRLFDGRIEQITQATGRELSAWLATGGPLAENMGEAFETLRPVMVTNDEWTSAIAELAAVSINMEDLTHKKLVEYWTNAGPSELSDLLAEIASVKGALTPLPASQAASDFVDAMDPEAISPEQYEALNLLINAYKIDRNALRAYCDKAGHLLKGIHGPSLARMKKGEFTKLRDRLYNQTIVAKNETQSARTIKIINKTIIPTSL